MRRTFALFLVLVVAALVACTPQEALSDAGSWLLAFLNTPFGEKLLIAALVAIAGTVYSKVSSKWQRLMCWVYEFMGLAERHGKTGERWKYFWNLFKERYNSEYGSLPGVGLERKINNVVNAISGAKNLNLPFPSGVVGSGPGE